MNISKKKIVFAFFVIFSLLITFFLTNIFLKENKISEEDFQIIPPSLSSEEYKLFINKKDIIEENSPFKLLTKKNDINIDINSDFVKKLKVFSENYIKTLENNLNDVDFNDFFIKKDEDIFNLIKEDFNENELLFKVNKSNFKIISNEKGAIEPTGAKVYLDILIEFKIESFKDKNDPMLINLEEGVTYRQVRSLILKRTENNNFKIYEQFIEYPKEK